MDPAGARVSPSRERGSGGARTSRGSAEAEEDLPRRSRLPSCPPAAAVVVRRERGDLALCAGGDGGEPELGRAPLDPNVAEVLLDEENDVGEARAS